jgi:hypothetical protein
VSDTGDDDHFMLYAPGSIPRLQDRAYFRRAIAQFYAMTAAIYGCSISLSDRRIGEAHDFWLADAERTLASATSDEVTELDHFKHAAFIAFWLRRLVPINDIYFSPPLEEGKAPEPKQIQFSRYGAEICALFAGFYICLSYETCAMADREEGEPVSVISDATGVKRMPAHFQSEFPRLLKHKNVSPQAIYMLYRGLFDQLEWDIMVRSPDDDPPTTSDSVRAA